MIGKERIDITVRLARWVRPMVVILAISLISITLTSTAAAQTSVSDSVMSTAGVKGKAVDVHATTGSASVVLRARVERGTTAGEGCLSITDGTDRWEPRGWEGGCGPLTVEVDDLLSRGRIRGSLTTSYGVYDSACNERSMPYGFCVQGSHQITLDATVSHTGAPGVFASDIVGWSPSWNTQACPPFYTAVCLVGQTLTGLPDDVASPGVPNDLVGRRGQASVNVGGSAFNTSWFWGTGLLYLQRESR